MKYALSKLIYVGTNRLGVSKLLPAKLYVKVAYETIMHKPLDLKNVKTFNEKLQWLKLYDHNPQYTMVVDKYAVKKYVASCIGQKYVIPTLGVWNKFNEIDFGKLPDQFVLKCTHNSGGVVVCRDKANFDKEAAKKKIEKALKKNYYWTGREWPYKNVQSRIIAEKLIGTETTLDDYKIMCFNGEPENAMVCSGRETGTTRYYFFDTNWELIRCNKWGIDAPEGFTLSPLKNIGMIIDVSCDRNGGVETSVPTTIQEPFYFVDGIMHYAVDHTPALFHKTFIINNSAIIGKYLDELQQEHCDSVMKNSLIIENGQIIDSEIKAFQSR